MTTLTAEADRLKEIHTNQAPEIEDKKTEISENWEKLKTKVGCDRWLCVFSLIFRVGRPQVLTRIQVVCFFFVESIVFFINSRLISSLQVFFFLSLGPSLNLNYCFFLYLHKESCLSLIVRFFFVGFCGGKML